MEPTHSKSTTAKAKPKYNMSKQEILQKQLNQLKAERDDLQERLTTEINMANFHANSTDHEAIQLDGSPGDLVLEMRSQLDELNERIKASIQTPNFRPKGMLRSFGKRPPRINQEEGFRSPNANDEWP